MLQVEPDTPHLWCVRNTTTGEYLARRHTREAAESIVDTWIREHADRLLPRDPIPVETPPAPDRWDITQLEAWALIEGRWWAYAGQPRRWISADQVRRHWPKERKHR